MRFIVGGSQGVFVVDNGSKKKVRGGHVYGVTFSREHLYCCERIRNGTNILRLDKDFKQIYAHRVPGGGVHQAHYDVKTKHLFVTITKADQLLEFDVDEKKEIARHKWAKGAEHHMNSVWRSHDTDAMYVYEHNTKGVAKENQQIGGVLRLDDNYKPIKTWEMANKGHNVFVDNGWLWVVNSFDECLMRKNMKSGQEEILITTKEYPAYAPRGLAVSDDYILMGLTELASRRDRAKTRLGLVCVYDRKTFKKLEEHEVAAGQIYEVRFLDRVDHAHNRLVFDQKAPVQQEEPKSDTHLFILGMNDSGTTFLQNVLSHCPNCVSFRHPKQRPHGMEGQGVAYWKKKQKGWYPRDIDHQVVKVFSEKAEIWREGSGKWNWKEIKNAWNEAWKKNDHFGKADPKVFLEKTPSSLFSVPMYENNFPGCRFLIIHRNPYVVCEGIRRTVKQHKKRDYSLKRCAEHWLACSKQQIENIERLCDEGKAIWFKYEDMVTKPGNIQKRIRQFIPALSDLDIRKEARCHSMDGNKYQPLKNYNNRQLKNLSPEDYAEINAVLDTAPEVLKFFGYQRRTEAP